MKAHVELAIDLEVKTKRRIPFFYTTTYAKVVYAGEMEVGDIRIGETLPLHIFNTSSTIDFVVRNIERMPLPGSKDVKTSIKLYHRTETYVWTKEGVRRQTLQECVARLHGPIAENLKAYELSIVEDSSKVGDDPTHVFIPSTVGATALNIATLKF